MRKVVIAPRYIDSIIVYNSDKDTAAAIANTKYKFDENGECELFMEFYDGIAYDVNGSGLIMTYPSQEKVQKHSILQNCIVNYTGIDDGAINQHDIALRYGKLVWTPNASDAQNKVFTKQEFDSIAEVIVTLAGDIYDKVYSVVGGYAETAQVIARLAIKFEDWWNENADEDTDFIFAIEDFEEKELKALGYEDEPELTEKDFDEPLPEDDDEPENTGDPVIDKCNKLTKAALELVEELTK